ncbi:lachesin [Tetranychus urticae]|uniref:Ig-like domain-containing protein n=1 Tax=Tetranychus urticae TaxID=32264 RepID=T1KYV0_TETUR|nr:lachesin [Tetranychus urticae]
MKICFVWLLIVTFHLWLSTILCQQEPTISFISKEKIVDLGETVELICDTVFTSGYAVQWIKLDNPPSILSSGSTIQFPDNRIGISVEKDRFKLKIRDVREVDNGEYMCQITSSSSVPIAKASVNLTVRIPPVISDDSTRHVITSVGTPVVKLKCSADGHPKPRISWRRDGNKELTGYGAHFIGSELTLTNITINHQGTYYCIADNGVARGDRRAISIEVEFPPLITVPKERVSQALKHNQLLVCKVRAFPLASISWYKEGDNYQEALSNNRNYNISIFQTNNEFEFTTILRVQNIEKRNYDRYYCQASNKLGTSKGIIELEETQNVICPPDCSSQYQAYGSDSSILKFQPSALIYNIIILIFANLFCTFA